jgi:hypothetical protein
MSGLQNTLAACLAAHAEAVERLGTDRPEVVAGSNHELIGRMIRQRARVAAALAGDDPVAVARHVDALTKGLRIAMRCRAVPPC